MQANDEDKLRDAKVIIERHRLESRGDSAEIVEIYRNLWQHSQRENADLRGELARVNQRLADFAERLLDLNRAGELALPNTQSAVRQLPVNSKTFDDDDDLVR
jgi:hypothetical protein